jgi:hypothetical protein
VVDDEPLKVPMWSSKYSRAWKYLPFRRRHYTGFNLVGG